MTRSQQIAAAAAAIAARVAASKHRLAQANIIAANAQLSGTADLMSRGTPGPDDTAAWSPAIDLSRALAGTPLP